MMNSLHKSLTIAFLAISIFISGLNVNFVGAQNTAVDPAASRRPADLLLSPYLRFGRLTAEDGLSSDQIFNLTQDNLGSTCVKETADTSQGKIERRTNK